MNLIPMLIDGRTDLIFKLVKTEKDVRLKDPNGIPLIKWCAYYGDVSAIRYLLFKGATLDALGRNFDLNGAAFHGHWQLLQFLLEHGADVNFTLPKTGESALHSGLCKANNPSCNYIVKLLLEYGANPNAQTTPHRESGGFMRDVYTKGETPLHRAAAFGNLQTIQLLLDAGADKAMKDVNGESPIGWASWHLRPGKILALLAHGNHRIHPLHEEKNQSDHGFGWGGGIYTNLLGQVHIP